jgi:hypothetical protein
VRLVGDGERVDFAREGVRLVGHDPLDHRQALLEF